MESKSDLKKEIKSYKDELINLKKSLNELGSQRSEIHRKRKENSAKIREMIEKVQSFRIEQKTIAERLKKSVADKESLYSELKPKLDELAKIDATLDEIKRKNGSAVSIDEIQRRIESLEYKIQTDVMSFDKEQKFNKEIKKLKALLPQASEMQEIFAKRRALIKEMKESRNKINEIKNSIIHDRDALKAIKKEKIQISQEIDKLKEETDKLKEPLDGLKAKLDEANNSLNEKISKIGNVSTELSEIITVEKTDRIRHDEKLALQRQEQVKEKIKRGEKLTTEDFLAFQNQY